MKDMYQQDYLMDGSRQTTASPYAGMYGYGTPFPQQAYPQQSYPQQTYPQQGYPIFPPQPSGATIPGIPGMPGLTSQIPGMLPLEESYIENILRLNKGKLGTFYFTYENNKDWNAKVYKGIVEAAGRDHIIISDPQTGVRHLLLMVNFDYATFDEELNYEYPYNGARPRPIPAR